jgi:glutathione-independent formaldehyde dehydrogenase
MVVDTHRDRLKLAEKIGAIAIDDTEGAGVERILELTGGKGADRGCECVGYQCYNMHREEVPNLTMNNLVQTVKATGRIGVVGVFVPEDPAARISSRSAGRLRSISGSSGSKGKAWGTGQANVKAYNRALSRLIERDKVKPSWIVSHELRSSRLLRPTRTSTSATTVGRRSC